MKVAIIGCGKIAQTRHIPEYIENPEAEIAGYYDFNLERASGLAKQFGGKVYDSADALLSENSIDAVSICTANRTHAELTVAALKAGKHVLCEKPMAVNLEDCEEMVKTAEACNRCLMIGQNQRLAKAHVKAKYLLEQGIIGEVITFKTCFGHGGPEAWSIDSGKGSWFFNKEKAAMGAMADLGVHKTDLIQFLLNTRVKEVSAKVLTLNKKDAKGNPIGVDDNAFCIYTMERGMVGTMTASWTYYGEEDNTTILYGTKGIMKLYDDPNYSLVVLLNKGEKIFYEMDPIQTNDHQTNSGIIDAFVDSIINKEPSFIDGSSVLTAMKAVFAAIKSSETGKTVVLQ